MAFLINNGALPPLIVDGRPLGGLPFPNPPNTPQSTGPGGLFTKTAPVPPLGSLGDLTQRVHDFSPNAVVNTGTGCDYACAHCGLGLFGSESSPGLCIECIRCYLVRGLKIIGLDILLGLVLLLALYLLFKPQADVQVQRAGRYARDLAVAG